MLDNYNMLADQISISGKWTNIRTGQDIQVRDSFIDGDEMIVRTVDGQIISMNDFSNNYIQSEEVDEDTSNSILKSVTSVPQSYGDIKPDFGKQVKTQVSSTVQTSSKQSNQALNTQQNLIDKIFAKINTTPNINIDFDWLDYPSTEMHMLVKYFDVSIDDISSYLYKTYFNEDIIKSKILDFLNKNMNNNTNDK